MQACPCAIPPKQSPAKIPAAQVFPKLFQALKYICNVHFIYTHFKASENLSPKRNLREKASVPKYIRNGTLSHEAGHALEQWGPRPGNLLEMQILGLPQPYRIRNSRGGAQPSGFREICQEGNRDKSNSSPGNSSCEELCSL